MSTKVETEREQETMTLYGHNFPRELQARAKANAALHRVTLTKWFQEAVREKLEREERRP